MIELVRAYRNLAFFAAGSFLSLWLMAVSMGAPFFGLIMAAMTTGLAVAWAVKLCQSGFPQYDPVRFRIGDAAVVAFCMCLVLFIYSAMRTPSSLDTVLGGKAEGMPSALVAVGQQALAKLPSASFVSIQATLGLLACAAAFCGVVAAGHHLGFTRFSALCTATVCCLCTLLSVGIDRQSYDYPLPCELAQQAYADVQTLDARDMAALARLGCRMGSAYVVQAKERVVIVKDRQSRN